MSEKSQFENQDKRVEYDNIIYLINTKENTAGIIGIKLNIQDIFIPTSIVHESKEYYVTSILEDAFKDSKIKSVQFSSDSKLEKIDKGAFFKSSIESIRIPSSVTSIGEGAFNLCGQLEVIEIPDDSELQTIGGLAFCCSSIMSIKIPSKLIDLEEGWCFSTLCLNEISVSPENPRYFCYEDKMIIGKTSIEQSNYDCLVFCVRNIQHILIPSFIEHICFLSFSTCQQLESVEFSNDSKLQTIEQRAFSDSSIKSIKIPSSVTSIGQGAFSNCTQLEVIEFSDDSKLETIVKDVFYGSAIKNIRISSKIINLKRGWCNCTKKLTKISISPENPRYCFFDDKMIIGKSRNEESNYDCLVFCVRNIREIKIPNFIERICSYSFNYCKQLENVEFSKDSKLQTIERYAFFDSTIKSIKIPSSVTSIGQGAFSNCKQLEVIEIPDDSKLQTINQRIFFYSKIKNFRIPSELIDLKEGWCSGAKNLTKISVSPENPRYFCYEDKMIIGKSKIEESNYDCLVFCVRDIREIKIPNFIEHICSYSFNWCKQLENVEFSKDSKLQTIDKYAFSSSTIKRIKIPSSVTSIGERAFEWCKQLEVIEFSDDSKLQMIDKYAFSDSSIKSIKISSSVTSIGHGAFSFCIILCIIEVANAEMISMYETAFGNCQDALLMIPVYS